MKTKLKSVFIWLLMGAMLVGCAPKEPLAEAPTPFEEAATPVASDDQLNQGATAASEPALAEEPDTEPSKEEPQREDRTGQQAVVISPIAQYYVKPGFNYGQDDEGWYGQTVTVLKDMGDGWYEVNTPYNYETYVNEKDICFDEKAVLMAADDNTALKRVWAAAADVVDAPEADGNVKLTLYRGAIVECGGAISAKGWTKVRLFTGETGYMRLKFLGEYYTSPAFDGDEDALREAVCDLAKQYLGVQYRWGGKTPLGLDCSGLTSACYLMYGVKIFRNAGIVNGFPVHEIDRQDIKKGDLMFFPGHTAIYLGDDDFIHCTSYPGSDGVVMGSFNPDHPGYRGDLEQSIYAVGSIF